MSADPRLNPGQSGNPSAMFELVLRSMLEAFAATNVVQARSYVATQCLSGMLINSPSAMDPKKDELRARRSVEQADALIAEIQRTQPLFDKLQADRRQP